MSTDYGTASFISKSETFDELTVYFSFVHVRNMVSLIVPSSALPNPSV